MESVHKPFETVYKALWFFLLNNPARSKSLNLLEPDTGYKSAAEQFAGQHSADRWASIACAIKITLASFPNDARKCFTLYYLDTSSRHSKDSIAKVLNLPLSVVRKFLRQTISDLETELFHRELIDYLLY